MYSIEMSLSKLSVCLLRRSCKISFCFNTTRKYLWFQVSLEDFLESCGGVATSSTGGGRTTGGPTLLTELEDDEDGVLEEEEDNEENDQEVISQYFITREF